MNLETYLQLFCAKHPGWEAVIGDTGGLALCEEVTVDLVAQFPELRRIWGEVELLDLDDPGDRRKWPHWWCTTPAGEIVDPTRDQFPGRITYHPGPAQDKRPTGRCPNCGDLAYDGNLLCSEMCERSYVAYCSGREPLL